ARVGNDRGEEKAPDQVVPSGRIRRERVAAAIGRTEPIVDAVPRDDAVLQADGRESRIELEIDSAAVRVGRVSGDRAVVGDERSAVEDAATRVTRSIARYRRVGELDPPDVSVAADIPDPAD